MTPFRRFSRLPKIAIVEQTYSGYLHIKMNLNIKKIKKKIKMKNKPI